MTKRKQGLEWVAGIILDSMYGALPAPFFVVGGDRIAPDVMMERIPGVILVATSLIVSGIGTYGGWQLGGEMMACCAIIPVLVHWVIFCCSYLPMKSGILFDLAGQIAFSIMSLYSYLCTAWARGSSARQNVVTFLCMVWSIRLGWFLFYRYTKRGGDFRFEKAEKNRKDGFTFFAWTNQGLWCFIQGIPLLLLQQKPSVPGPSDWDWTDLTGWVGFFAGLMIESSSDSQKLRWVLKYPKRKSRPYIDSGFWAYSRHPNYAGESLIWMSIALSCLGSFTDQREFLITAGAALFFSIIPDANFSSMAGVPCRQAIRENGILSQIQTRNKCVLAFAKEI
mmetsp:Transcript_25054/g.54065  ORF Transcript_25054/g.54065 Transcript_25054/m.54065 type:complete len:337 (-) Transcript_25054:561-1571(-)